MSVKSFMRKCTVTAAAVSCFVFLCTAQQNGGGRMVMSIGDIFAIADSASSSIRVFQTGVSAAEEALSAARSQRLPDISVSASVSYLGDGILWDRNFGNPQKIDIPHFGNNLAIEAQQVIYAGGAVSSGIETARLEQNEAMLRLAEAAVELAELNLSYTVIIAPCDGVAGSKDIHEGQLVQPGQTMLEIVDGGGLWVIANYRETQLRHITEGAQVSITADAVPGGVYSGVVEAVSDATGAAFSILPQDNATGNFVKVEQRVPVRIALEGNAPEHLDLLRAGFNVECRVKY